MNKIYFKQIEDNYCIFHFYIIDIEVSNLINLPVIWLKIINFSLSQKNNYCFCLPLYDTENSIIICSKDEIILYRPDNKKLFIAIDDLDSFTFIHLIINTLLEFQSQWIPYLNDINNNANQYIDLFNQLYTEYKGLIDE